MTRSRRLRLLAALAALSQGCASAPRADEGPPATTIVQPARPLRALAGMEGVVFLPTRYLVVNEGLRWAELAGNPAAILGALDYDLHLKLRERRIGEEWIWPDGARRAAARSAGMVPDPRRFLAEPLLDVPAGRPVAVPDPLASNLRALAALTDARHVLYPVRLSFVPTTASPTGPARAVLRLVLVDVRTATVQWTGEVASDPAPRYGPALPASIASRVADLFVPPAQ